MSTLKQAMRLAREGREDEATTILRELVTRNPNDLYAWLWLAECTTNPIEARDAAQKVLHRRSTHQRAQNILKEAEAVLALDEAYFKRKNDADPRKRKPRRWQDWLPW
jgi:thioredoxin-like negative regulator of GroEL